MLLMLTTRIIIFILIEEIGPTFIAVVDVGSFSLFKPVCNCMMLIYRNKVDLSTLNSGLEKYALRCLT